MKYIFKNRLFCAISGNVRLPLCLLFLLLIAGCVKGTGTPGVDDSSSKYNAEELAKDWREQVRKNPQNPYEGYNYPADNDSEYSPPRKPKKISPYDNEDSNYGKFPRYNPDDDNMPIDPKHYPLYWD